MKVEIEKQIERLIRLIKGEIEGIIALGVEAKVAPVRAALGLVPLDAERPNKVAQRPGPKSKAAKAKAKPAKEMNPGGRTYPEAFKRGFAAKFQRARGKARKRMLTAHGVAQTTAYKWLKEYGDGTGKQKRKLLDVPTKLQYAEEAKREGVSYVAKRYGVNDNGLRKWMKGEALGVPGRSEPPPASP